MLDIRQAWQVRPWTEDEDNILRTRREGGDSFGTISKDLGRSRNSCISRANRIGIAKSGKPKRAEPAPRTPRPKKPPKSIDAVGKQLTFLPFDKSENPVKFFDLEWHHCRWPLEGEGINTLFCGDHIHAEHSYCYRHFRLSTRRESNRTRGEAELHGREMRREFKARAA